MSVAKDFCLSLVEQVPEVRTVLDEHLTNNDELLPNVFLGDITRYVLANRPARQEIVAFLELQFRQQCAEIEELIAVAFVENVETIEDLQNATSDVDAPELAEEWKRQKYGYR